MSPLRQDETTSIFFLFMCLTLISEGPRSLKTKKEEPKGRPKKKVKQETESMEVEEDLPSSLKTALLLIQKKDLENANSPNNKVSLTSWKMNLLMHAIRPHISSTLPPTLILPILPILSIHNGPLELQQPTLQPHKPSLQLH